MRRPIALAVSVVAGSLAPAAAAQTPTLAPLKPCYVTAGLAAEAREPVNINAQGLTRNGTATVAIDGTMLADQAQVDPMGGLVGSPPAPLPAPRARALPPSV